MMKSESQLRRMLEQAVSNEPSTGAARDAVVRRARHSKQIRVVAAFVAAALAVTGIALAVPRLRAHTIAPISPVDQSNWIIEDVGPLNLTVSRPATWLIGMTSGYYKGVDQWSDIYPPLGAHSTFNVRFLVHNGAPDATQGMTTQGRSYSRQQVPGGERFIIDWSQETGCLKSISSVPSGMSLRPITPKVLVVELTAKKAIDWDRYRSVGEAMARGVYRLQRLGARHGSIDDLVLADDALAPFLLDFLERRVDGPKAHAERDLSPALNAAHMAHPIAGGVRYVRYRVLLRTSDAPGPDRAVFHVQLELPQTAHQCSTVSQTIRVARSRGKIMVVDDGCARECSKVGIYSFKP